MNQWAPEPLELPSLPGDKPKFDAEKAAKAALIDIKKKVQKPPSIISIRQDLKEVDICTLGNISLLSGKAKSRKTFTLTMMITAAIICDYVCDKIRGTLPEGKKGILCLDTEQSEYHAQSAIKRAMNLAGIDETENFHPYMLRNHSTEERKSIFEYLIANTPNLGLVVIDGIRDMVESVNDEAECKKIVDWLMMLSTKYFCHIMVVIHENKVGGQIRGHLGTELQNKAETVISVEKVEGDQVSIVSARETRGMPFEPFAIYYNETTKLPDIDHNYEINKGAKKGEFKHANKKKVIESFTHSEHCDLLGKIFSMSDRMRLSDLLANVKDLYPMINAEDVRRNARSFFVDNGYLHTNAEEEKNKAQIMYWLTDIVKKEKSPF